jgi:hypothetical protein
MKTALHVGSMFAIVLALVGITSVWLPVQPGSATHQITFDGFPLDKPRTIEFSPDDENDLSVEEIKQLSENQQQDRRRRRLDQLRDWLLLTAVTATGLSPQVLNQSLYDLPTIRHDTLRRVANFEYGETRSRAIGDGQVVGLVPVSTAAEQLDHLAQIADEQRKSMGKIPATIFVFEYDLEPKENYARLTRRQAIDGNLVFTEQAGYFEYLVRNLADLDQFMAKVDDITFARIAGSNLILGGRKHQARTYRRIRVEDVAALWKSERGLSGYYQGSGFSLDPGIDLSSVSEAFDSEIASRLASEASINADGIQRAKAALGQTDGKRLFAAALDAYCKAQKEGYRQCLDAVEDILWAYRYQVATYYGDLQGTEVGMVLFYTDLLMKLWGLDYLESTPRRITGFPVKTDMKVSAIYRKELEKSPRTRLWLASLDQGFQVADGGKSLLFARTATRVFARPHDFLTNADRTDVTEPNVFNRAFMNWWNDHYEEIAHYEPEYQRLNQVMKWSQVIGWLNAASKGDLLKFLDPVEITRSHWFPKWVLEHPELTFQSWEEIGFYEEGYDGTNGEVVQILTSKAFPFFETSLMWSGGVSLADRGVFAERTALAKEIPTTIRRANLDYSLSDPTAGRLRTLEQTEYRFHNFAEDAAATIARARQNVKVLQGEWEGLASLEFERAVRRTSDGLLVRTRAGGTSFGDLRVARTAEGFKVGWESRDLDLGQSLARRLSTSSTPERLLALEPDVETVIRLPDDVGFLVKARGTERWIKFAVAKTEGSAPPPGFQARIAGFGDEPKPIDVAWLDHSAMKDHLKGQGYLQIAPSKGGAVGTTIEPSARGPPAGAREIHLGKAGNVKALVDPQTELIYVRWQDLPEAVRNDPGRLAKLVERGGDLATSDYVQLARKLESKSYNEAARELVLDPSGFEARIQQHLAEELRRNNLLMQSHQLMVARRHIDDMIHMYGELPEFSLRKAVLEAGSGKVGRAAATLQETVRGPLRHPTAFFDEINQQLASTKLGAQERANLENIARLADWREHQVRSIAAKSDMVPLAKADKLMLEFRLKELPQGKPVAVEDILKGDAIVYIQDSPGLNNLDLTPATHNSLRALISGNKVTVRELPLADLAHYKPAVIFETKTNMSLHLADESNILSRLPPSSYTRFSSAGSNADDEEKEPQAYVIIENSTL